MVQSGMLGKDRDDSRQRTPVGEANQREPPLTGLWLLGLHEFARGRRNPVHHWGLQQKRTVSRFRRSEAPSGCGWAGLCSL